MKRIALAATAILIAVPAYAGFFQSVSVDELGNTTRTTIRTPEPAAPRPAPIFSTTVETKRKDNGNKVVITTTYRNGVEWSKERAVTHANRGNGNGGNGKGRGR